MQINDNLISKLRIFRKSIIDSGYNDIRMPVYSIPNLHACSNPVFQNKGYYKRHNGEFWLCKESEEDSADFCILECETCHQEVALLNTGVQNWDNFSINSKKKIKETLTNNI